MVLVKWLYLRHFLASAIIIFIMWGCILISLVLAVVNLHNFLMKLYFADYSSIFYMNIGYRMFSILHYQWKLSLLNIVGIFEISISVYKWQNLARILKFCNPESHNPGVPYYWSSIKSRSTVIPESVIPESVIPSFIWDVEYIV